MLFGPPTGLGATRGGRSSCLNIKTRHLSALQPYQEVTIGTRKTLVHEMLQKSGPASRIGAILNLLKPPGEA